MKTNARLWMLAGGMTLASFNWCDSSAMVREADEEASAIDATQRHMSARDAVAPTRARESEWRDLRGRYQVALTRRGEAAVADLLRQARMTGSATLARSAAARERFHAATLWVARLAGANEVPTLERALELDRAITAYAGDVLRPPGIQATRQTDRTVRYTPGNAVRDELLALFDELDSPAEARRSIPERAARFDQRLISIHPFKDGNGRTTRLLTDWLLATGGYPPIVQTRTADVPRTGGSRVSPSAHLERITDGMRASVELLEAAS